MDDINRAMLIGQSPAQATALLGSAERMLLATEAAPPQQAQEPPPPQPPPPQPQAPQPAEVTEVRTAPPTPVPAPSPAPSVNPATNRAPVADATPAPPVSALPAAQNPRPPEASASDESRKIRDANRLYRKGRDYSEQEKFEEAVQAFDQALQLDASLALALNSRGYATFVCTTMNRRSRIVRKQFA